MGAFLPLARLASEQADRLLRSGSGADRAQSERYYGRARVLSAVAAGADLETEIAREAVRWRTYAAAQAAKVSAAPKIALGPMDGASWIQHRWVGGDEFDRIDAPFLRAACASAAA